MEIRKAIITAAGRGARLYPAATTVDKGMQPFIDRDGLTKPLLQIIAEEALGSGIEAIGIVCAPGDEQTFRARFEALRANLLEAFPGVAWAQDEAERLATLLGRVHFCVQHEPLGYGHAVLTSKEFVGDEPFLLLLGDHLYLSHRAGERCAAQLLQAARRERKPVAAAQATPEHLVGRYGTLRGKRIGGADVLYEVDRIVEKPSLSKAEIELHTPGLRAGHYLCLFGMYVLTPEIFPLLAERVAAPAGSRTDGQLTSALQAFADRKNLLALEVDGTRHDVGAPYGILHAQLALALHGRRRDEVLRDLLTLLAEDKRASYND